MNEILFKEDVVNVVQSFCMCKSSDDKSADTAISIGAELLDISEDEMLSMVWCGVNNELRHNF